MRACSCTIFDLYAAPLGPVESAIARRPKLLMVPTSALTSLPFHVPETRDPDAAVAPDDRYRLAAWLLNDRAITALPSVASLRAARLRKDVSRDQAIHRIRRPLAAAFRQRNMTKRRRLPISQRSIISP